MRKRIWDAYRVLKGDMKAIPKDASWFCGSGPISPVYTTTTGNASVTYTVGGNR